METTLTSPILEKLKKLLTLSRGATGAEAETALGMATKLATKYEIDIATISLDSAPKKEEMIKDTIEVGNRMSVAQKWISWLIVSHFKVTVIYGGGRWSGRKIHFLGRKSDVEFATYVQDFLREHMLRSWQYYQKANNIETRYRGSYFDGFYRGLDTKLKAAKKSQEGESFEGIAVEQRATVKDRYALALVNDAEERKAFVNQTFGKLSNSYQRTYIHHNHTANGAGFSAGQATNIARPLK